MHTVLVTGAAGYVGAMLCDQFARRGDVKKIIAIDPLPRPALLAEHDMIEWITAWTDDREAWEARAAAAEPDIVINAAWQIRESYGAQNVERAHNVDGSRAVFDFVFRHSSVKRLVHVSTAAVYGAFASNTLEHFFTEDEPLREKEYSYAVEKIAAEDALRAQYESAKQEGRHAPVVSIVRPSAVTGPRGRFMRMSFGLQSALAGRARGNIFHTLVSRMLAFVPATPRWARQFIHEDDVTDIVALLAFDERVTHEYEAFNITPPGAIVRAGDMAKAVGKRVLPLRPWMIRPVFFIAWHLSRGRVPTAAGVWRFYSYPILLNGDTITARYGYRYRYGSQDAFTQTAGRYEYAAQDTK